MRVRIIGDAPKTRTLKIEADYLQTLQGEPPNPRLICMPVVRINGTMTILGTQENPHVYRTSQAALNAANKMVGTLIETCVKAVHKATKPKRLKL